MTDEERGRYSEELPDGHQNEVDAVLDVLSDPYRRRVLYYLREQGETSVEELTTVLTGWSNARESGQEVATPERRHRVAILLHHHHLPMLAAYGAVDYDRDSATVELQTVSDCLAAYLDLSLEMERANDEPSRREESARSDGRPASDESG